MQEHPLEDRLVDGIAGVARGSWKAVKKVAPVVGRVGWKVTKRAAKAVASNPTVQKCSTAAAKSAFSRNGAESLFKQFLYSLWR